MIFKRVLVTLLVACALWASAGPRVSARTTPQGIYAFPELGGVKLRCGFTVFRPFDGGGGTEWRDVWYNAITNADGLDAWAHWVKPQINALHSIGGNCVSLIFSAGLFVGSTNVLGVPKPKLTSGQMSALVDLVCDYAASLGMWVFPSIGDTGQFGYWSVSNSDMQSYITEISKWLSLKSNVFGIVAMDEIDIPGGTSDPIYTNANLWVAAAKAGFTTRTVPVTCTVGAAVSTDYSGVGAPLIAAGVDFLGANGFGSPAFGGSSPSTWNNWVFNAGNGAAGTTDIPFVIPSAGVDTRGGTLAQDVYYDAMNSWVSLNRIQMIGAWTIVSYGTGGGGVYGMFEITQDGSYVFTTPRTHMTDRFSTFPIVPGPYDSSEDGGALVESAPTVVTRTLTTAALTWTAPVGGVGTITRTPQYVQLDAHGFPTQLWQSGSSGTSDSQTLTVPNARVAFRVKSTGSPAPSGSGTTVTYSAWAISEIPQGPRLGIRIGGQ